MTWIYRITFLLFVCFGGTVAVCTVNKITVTNGSQVVDVQDGYAFELQCQVKPLDHSHVLLWYFQKNIDSPWEIYPFSWGVTKYNEYVQLLKQNQTLLVKVALKVAEGNYQCVSYNATASMNTTWSKYTVKTYDCVEGRTIPVTHSPKKSQLADIGEKVRVSCYADFGCKLSSLNTVEWFVVNDGNVASSVCSLHNSPYSVNLVNRNLGRNLNATLTLSVREEDYDVKFQCRINYAVHNNNTVKSLNFPFNLQQKVIIADSGPLTRHILFILISALLVTVVVTAVVWWNCKTYVILYCRTRVEISSSFGEGLYNLVILHDNKQHEDDLQLARCMSECLIKKNIKVATFDEIPGNCDENEEIRRIIRNSSTAVFLMPQEQTSQELENLFNFIEGYTPRHEIIPLKYVVISGVDKQLIGFRRKGILSKALNHLPRPDENNMEVFCENLIKKLHLDKIQDKVDTEITFENQTLQHHDKEILLNQ